MNRAYPTYDHKSMVDLLGIRSEDLVLDAGGGSRPLGRSDVVVDLHIEQGHDRDGCSLCLEKDKHVYVQADITALPFADKSFDFIFCVQVLEHVRDPAMACEELMRVVKRGFLETPRKWTDIYAGYPTHRWLIDQASSVIVFEPVTFAVSPFLNFALPPVWESSDLLQRATSTYRNIPCVQIVWEDRFKYHVSTQELDTTRHDDPHALAIRHYSFARNLLYWLVDPRRGLYNASRANELVPDNLQYSQLYAFYLILCGQWKKAGRLNLSPGLAVRAAAASLTLRIAKRHKSWFRRLVSIFPVG